MAAVIGISAGSYALLSHAFGVDGQHPSDASAPVLAGDGIHLQLEGEALSLAGGQAGSAWVAVRASEGCSSQIMQISPNGEVVAQYDVQGGFVSDMAVASSLIALVNSCQGADELQIIKPGEPVSSIRLPTDGAYSVAATGEVAWVSAGVSIDDREGEILKVDLQSLDVEMRISIPGRLRDVVAHSGYAWVLNTSSQGSVSRIDSSGDLTVLPLQAPYALAAGPAGLWVSTGSYEGGEVDVKRLTIDRTVHSRFGFDAFAVDSDSVWMVGRDPDQGDRAVFRLDASTGQIRRQASLAEDTSSVVLEPGSDAIWSVTESGLLSRAPVG